MMTDPIADFLTRIRNACMARYRFVQVPASRLKIRIAEILKEEGFLEDFQVVDLGKGKRVMELRLKYDEYGEPVIEGLERVSRPGRRVYAGYQDLTPVRGGLGISILSTSKGILSDREALRQKVGGEIMLKVW